MKVTLLFLIICALSVVRSDTYAYSQTYTSTLAPSGTQLSVRSGNSAYDNFNVVWDASLSNNLEVSALVQSDSQDVVNAFVLNMQNVAGVSTLVVTQTPATATASPVPATTVPTVVPTSVATSVPTNAGAATAGATVTAAAATGATPTASSATPTATDRLNDAPSNVPSFTLMAVIATLFVFPRNRYMIALLVVVALVFSQAHGQTAVSAVRTNVTITIKVPISLTHFCVSGVCFDRSSGLVPATAYISLFGKRYATIDVVPGNNCSTPLVPMTVPANWTLASFDDASQLLTKLALFGGSAFAYAFNDTYAYNIKTLIKASSNPYFSPDHIITNDCNIKVIISQNFPIPEPWNEAVGYPHISNFVTFGGFDYAVADNTAYGNTTLGFETFAFYVDAASEWTLAPYEAASLIALQSHTVSFGSNYIVVGLNSYTSALTLGATNVLLSSTYLNGTAYSVDFSKGYSRILIRRVSTTANATWASSIAITNKSFVNGAYYATLDNLDPASAAGVSDGQARFVQLPSGWSLATPSELAAFVKTVGYSQFAVTYCFFTSGAALDPTGANCTGSPILLNQTANGQIYYVPSAAGRVVIKNTLSSNSSFTMGMKILLLTIGADQVYDSQQQLAYAVFNATGVLFDKINLLDSQNNSVYSGALPLVDANNNPKYYAIVLGSFELQYTDLTGATVSAITVAQRAQLNTYKYQFNVRMVSLSSYPGGALTGFAADTKSTGLAVALDSTYAATNPYTLNGLVKSATFNTTGVYTSPATIPTNAQPFLRLVADATVVGPASAGGVVGAIVTNTDKTLELHFFIATSDTTTFGVILGNVWLTWVTKGLWMGERRVYFCPQVDDLLLATTQYSYAEGSPSSTARMTGTDMTNVLTYLRALVVPAGSDPVALEYGINGAGAGDGQGNSKPAQYLTDKLYLAIQAHVNDFYWETHTWDHLDFTCVQDETVADANDHVNCNATTYSQAFYELTNNTDFFNNYLFKSTGGINSPTFSTNCMITPAITGLQNPAAIQAILDNGIYAVVGDNSVPFLQPENKYHGLITNNVTNGYPGLFIVPRQATEIYYDCATPLLEVTQYNARYGVNGSIVALGFNKTLDQIIAFEVANTIPLLTSYRHDPYMFHQANLVHFNYSRPGEAIKSWTLLTLWIQGMIDGYDKLLTFPIRNASHPVLWHNLQARMDLDNCQITPTLTVVNGTLTTIAIQSTNSCIVPITGLSSCGGATGCSTETYGPDKTVHIDLSNARSSTITTSLTW